MKYFNDNTDQIKQSTYVKVYTTNITSNRQHHEPYGTLTQIKSNNNKKKKNAKSQKNS